MSSEDRFVAGSEDVIVGTVKDRQGGILVPLDLTGSTVKLEICLNDEETIREVSVVPDPNQEANPGRFTYQLSNTDLAAGYVDLGVRVTSPDQKVHRTKTVRMGVEPALVPTP